VASVPAMSEQVSVSREIAAPAERLYDMVSDVTRMGEWSPETQAGEWLGGATGATPGAKFRATNRVGKRSWKTVATVVDAEPGRRFSFVVTAGPLKAAEAGRRPTRRPPRAQAGRTTRVNRLTAAASGTRHGAVRRRRRQPARRARSASTLGVSHWNAAGCSRLSRQSQRPSAWGRM